MKVYTISKVLILWLFSQILTFTKMLLVLIEDRKLQFSRIKCFTIPQNIPAGAINSFEGIQKMSQSWHLNWILKDEWTFASWKGKEHNELREMF